MFFLFQNMNFYFKLYLYSEFYVLLYNIYSNTQSKKVILLI